MFYYERIENKYYIWSDNTKGKYGPFEGVYVKNTFFWETDANFEVEKYPAYKYAIWFWKSKICVINTQTITQLFDK